MLQAPKKNSNRVEKVNSLIQHLLGGILLPYTVPLKGLVTVTKVQCSKDLRWAKVWVSNVDGDEKATLNTFNNNIYDIQGELNRQLAMKMVPRISFHLDTSGQYADHINKIFKKIEDERSEQE